jgi:hypothetical protein
MKNLNNYLLLIFAFIVAACGGGGDPDDETIGPGLSQAPLKTPAFNATDVSLTPTLEWDNVSEGVKYDVVIYPAEGTKTTTLATDLTTTTYTLTDEQALDDGVTYVWRVNAKLNGETKSAESKFTTLLKTHYDDGDYYFYKNLDGTRVPDGGKPYVIVVMGDGFVTDHYPRAGGYFDSKVDPALDLFFDTEPFKTYKDYFKVYKLVAISNESGLSSLRDGGTVVDTKFKLRHRASGTVIEIPDGYWDVPFNFVYDHVPEMNSTTVKGAMLYIFGNSEIHGGTNWSFDDGLMLSFSAVGAKTSYEKTFMHEAGHAIGKVSDEYWAYTAPAAMTAQQQADNIAKQQANPESMPNVDFTGDRDKARWAKYYGMKNNGTPYDVDYIEGGMGYGTGVWRPSDVSIMRGSTVNNPAWFNVVSREAIVRQLMKSAGQQFDWEDFLKKDNDAKPANFNPGSRASGGHEEFWAPEHRRVE